MSSTMRTWIVSAIRRFVPSTREAMRGWGGGSVLTTTGAGPGGPSRPSRLARGGPAGSWPDGWLRPGARLGREHGLDQLRRQDAVGIDEGLEDHAGGLVRDRGDGLATGVDEVVGRAEDERDRGVQLRELDELGLLGVDGQDDDLLLAVEGGRTTRGRRAGGRGGFGGRFRGRQQRAE